MVPSDWGKHTRPSGPQGDHLHYLHQKLMREPRSCPACEDDTLRPIIYGLVTGGELHEKADRGEVVLGGCQVGQDAPDWECGTCGRHYQADQLGRDR